MPGGNEDMNLEEEVLVNHEDTSNVDVQMIMIRKNLRKKKKLTHKRKLTKL